VPEGRSVGRHPNEVRERAVRLVPEHEDECRSAGWRATVVTTGQQDDDLVKIIDVEDGARVRAAVWTLYHPTVPLRFVLFPMVISASVDSSPMWLNDHEDATSSLSRAWSVPPDAEAR